LERRPFAVRRGRGAAYEDRHRCGQFRADDHSLARRKHGHELSGTAVEIATGTLDRLTVLIIG
jgi:hypothetical protein